MRLTAVLLKQSRARYYRELYKIRRTLKPTDWGIPNHLLQKGVPIYDPLKLVNQREPFDFEKYLPIEKKELQPEWAYMVPSDIRFTDPLIQTQQLTNSLYYQQLPPAYEASMEKTEVSDDEISWFDGRLKILQHDSYQERLDMVYSKDKEKYWYKLGRKYGSPIVRKHKQLSDLFNEYVKLLDSDSPFKAFVRELECQFVKPLVNPYIYQGKASGALLAKSPLESVTEVPAQGALPSMYPAVPEIDLKKSYDYEPKTKFPINGGIFHLHTLFVNHPFVDNWSAPEKLATAINQTFTFAAAKSATSNEPLTLQCVYHDMKTIDFLVYQLNTLKFGSPETVDSVRNQVWHMSVPLKIDDDQRVNPTALKLLKVFNNK